MFIESVLEWKDNKKRCVLKAKKYVTLKAKSQ